MKRPPVHPAAELFPMIDDAGLAELAEDIRTNGLQRAVVLFDGKVLDGRNRLLACERAGVEPRFETLALCDSPTAYVLSANLLRRHLSDSQRTMAGARALPLFEEEARARELAGRGSDGSGGRGRKKDLENPSAERQQGIGRAAEKAAALVNTSARAIYRASKVLKDGAPELVAAVDAGKVSVTAAAEATKLSKAEQKKLAREGVPPTKKREAKREESPLSRPTFDPSHSPVLCTHCSVTHGDWLHEGTPDFLGAVSHAWICARCGRPTPDADMGKVTPIAPSPAVRLRRDVVELTDTMSVVELEEAVRALRAIVNTRAYSSSSQEAP